MAVPEVALDLPEDEAAYCVTPGEVDRLVGELRALNCRHLEIDSWQQYAGRRVYALTFTDRAKDHGSKRRMLVSRPHAHEPAGVAAMTELAKLLAGCEEAEARYGGHGEWRSWALERFVLTLVPDANPAGSQRAPVKFWDGTEIPNDKFFLWMFGESGETPGERFGRVPSWDIRSVTPPALLGIAYEQISEHEYVEPNRDHRSTFFRSFFELDERYSYHLWMDLHQTEFQRSDRNACVHLPMDYDRLSGAAQDECRALAEAVHARWRLEGGSPTDEPVIPYRGEGGKVQREFLEKAWAPVNSRLTHVSTEVQNNNPRTPPHMQVRLQLAAVMAAMEWLAGAGQTLTVAGTGY